MRNVRLDGRAGKFHPEDSVDLPYFKALFYDKIITIFHTPMMGGNSAKY